MHETNVPQAVEDRTPAAWKGGSGIGSGWTQLVAELDAAVAALIPDYEVNQCKEKFGALRFYVTFPEGSDPNLVARARALISEAESRSAAVCEVCGDVGTSGGRGWIGTLCPVHREEAETPTATL